LSLGDSRDWTQGLKILTKEHKVLTLPFLSFFSEDELD
jgi:hypothetical protein